MEDTGNMSAGSGEELPSLVMVGDVNYLYGRYWNWVEGWIFCVLHVNPLVERLHMELSEDYV